MTSLREELGFQRGTGEDPWWRRAACRDYPLDLFHPTVTGHKDKHDTTPEDRAKRVCARCPVRVDCLREALVSESARPSEKQNYERRLPSGVWGGQGERQRWEKDVTHLDTCHRGRSCTGCRPIGERVEILEARFRADAPRFLTSAEAVA